MADIYIGVDLSLIAVSEYNEPLWYNITIEWIEEKLLVWKCKRYNYLLHIIWSSIAVFLWYNEKCS
jgi:hypothetical protein